MSNLQVEMKNGWSLIVESGVKIDRCSATIARVLAFHWSLQYISSIIPQNPLGITYHH